MILLLFWLLILITGVDSTYRNEALRPSFVTTWTVGLLGLALCIVTCNVEEKK